MEPILDSTKKIRHHLSVLGRVGFKLLLKKVPESLLHDLFHLEYDNSIKMKGETRKRDFGRIHVLPVFQLHLQAGSFAV